VREKATMFFLLGVMLLVMSSLLPSIQSYQVNRTSEFAIPSQVNEPIAINGNIELSQRSSGGVGTRSDPYLLAGLDIVSTGTCIYIQNTTAFFAILGCDLESTGGSEPVVLLDNVENGLIRDCYIKGGSNGVSLLLSVDCIVNESVFFNNYNGIQIYGSENCTILECKIFNNIVGMSIDYSNGSIITNSSVYSNSNRGVSIGDLSDGAVIYRNNIGWNGVNAYDNGQNSDFTNGVGTGNAWSDYDGSGGYEVPGLSSAIDTYATILIDGNRPLIDSPIDSYGETLTWIASDDFPFSYLLYIDDIPQDLEIWDGREITISLDALPVGTHTLVMTVQDAAGNVESDEVIATAVSFILGGIGTELVIWSSALTVAILFLVVVIIKKMP